MVNFSKLNKPIVFQIRQIIPDGHAGFADLWRDYFQTWANIAPINNLNPQIRSKSFNNNFYKFTIRERKGLPKYMRIKMAGKLFYVETIKETYSNDGYMEVIAYERVKDELPTKN